VKIEWTIWVGGLVFAAAIAIVYAIVGDEPAGVTLLVCAVAFMAIVAGWITMWRLRHGDRPSDDTDADMAAASEPIGVFAAASLRPLVLGAGMTAIVLGLVLGIWLTLVGSAIVASQVALLIRDIDS
jgi:hypothetical protein